MERSGWGWNQEREMWEWYDVSASAAIAIGERLSFFFFSHCLVLVVPATVHLSLLPCIVIDRWRYEPKHLVETFSNARSWLQVTAKSQFSEGMNRFIVQLLLKLCTSSRNQGLVPNFSEQKRKMKTWINWNNKLWRKDTRSFFFFLLYYSMCNFNEMLIENKLYRKECKTYVEIKYKSWKCQGGGVSE